MTYSLQSVPKPAGIQISLGLLGLPGGLSGKESACSARKQRLSPWECPLEDEMETHSNIIAWEIPWTQEPDELQSIGWQRVKWDKHTHTYTRKLTLTFFFFFYQEVKQRLKTNFIMLELNLFLGKVHFPPQLQNYIFYLWTSKCYFFCPCREVCPFMHPHTFCISFLHNSAFQPVSYQSVH